MSYYQIILRFWICLSIIFSPIILINSANAATVGGWSLGGGVAQGASTVYNGTKQVIINGADYIKKGTAKITPNAAQVAKVLRGGAAGYALSIAVEQMLGAVDWVLDPANNAIKYKEGQKNDGSLSPKFQYRCAVTPKVIANTTTECGQIYLDKQPAHLVGFTEVVSCQKPSKLNDDFSCTFRNPNGQTSNYISGRAVTRTEAMPEEEQEKSIPLDAVAQQVISNANAGDTHAQAATTAAAADIVAEAETDSTKARPIVQQLEASAQTTPKDETAADNAGTATGESTANPETGATDLKLEFPVFCNWAPSVCEAAQVVISFPQTLTNWWETATTQVKDWATSISEAWTATKEWFKSEPEQETELPDPPDPIEVTDTEFHFDSSCPAPMTLANFSYHGHQQNWEVDFSGLCSSLETFVKPVVIAMGALTAVYIVSGTRDD